MKALGRGPCSSAEIQVQSRFRTANKALIRELVDFGQDERVGGRALQTAPAHSMPPVNPVSFPVSIARPLRIHRGVSFELLKAALIRGEQLLVGKYGGALPAEEKESRGCIKGRLLLSEVIIEIFQPKEQNTRGEADRPPHSL